MVDPRVRGCFRETLSGTGANPWKELGGQKCEGASEGANYSIWNKCLLDSALNTGKSFAYPMLTLILTLMLTLPLWYWGWSQKVIELC